MRHHPRMLSPFPERATVCFSSRRAAWHAKVSVFLLASILFLLIAFPSTARSTEPILRVGLGGLRTKLTLRFPSGGEGRTGRRVIERFRAGQAFTWQIVTASPAASKRGRGRRPKPKPPARSPHIGRTLVFVTRGKPLILDGKPYRGSIEISFGPMGARVVNRVGLEDYTLGVVGKEIGSRSPAESLKAQAVIARTYAFASKGRHGKDDFDVCDSTHCQVYGGVEAERATVESAVTETRGIVMISDGVPIATLYHATCGGMTSDNDAVFGGAATSYLRRVQCPFCAKGINYRWTRRLSLDILRTRLASENIHFDRLFEATASAVAPLDRVHRLMLDTDTGRHHVKGTTIRRLFALPSTTFMVVDDTSIEHPTPPPSSPSRCSLLACKPFEGFPRRLYTDVWGGRATAGPAQLIVQTAQGLSRTARPPDGWVLLAFGVSTAVSRPKDRIRQSVTTLTLFGRGFGHQVGLCQAGSIELGRRSWSYRQILAYYYRNVALRRLCYATPSPARSFQRRPQT